MVWYVMFQINTHHRPFRKSQPTIQRGPATKRSTPRRRVGMSETGASWQQTNSHLAQNKIYLFVPSSEIMPVHKHKDNKWQ